MNNFSWNRVKHLLLMQMLDGGSSPKKKRILPAGMGIRLLLLSALLALAGIFVSDNYKPVILIICMVAAMLPFLFFLRDKSKAANFLLVPASAKEKIIALFILVVGNVVIFLVTTVFIGIALSKLMNHAAGCELFTPAFFSISTTRFISAFMFVSIFYCLALSSWSWVGFLIRFFACYMALIFAHGITTAILFDELTIALDFQYITARTIFKIVLFSFSLSLWIIGYYQLKKHEI